MTKTVGIFKDSHLVKDGMPPGYHWAERIILTSTEDQFVGQPRLQAIGFP